MFIQVKNLFQAESILIQSFLKIFLLHFHIDIYSGVDVVDHGN